MHESNFEAVLNRIWGDEQITLLTGNLDTEQSTLRLTLQVDSVVAESHANQFRSQLKDQMPGLKSVGVVWRLNWNSAPSMELFSEFWSQMALPLLKRKSPACYPSIAASQWTLNWEESLVELVLEDEIQLETVLIRKCDQLLQRFMASTFNKPFRIQLSAESAAPCPVEYLAQREQKTEQLVREVMSDTQRVGVQKPVSKSQAAPSGKPAGGTWKRERQPDCKDDPRVIYKRLIRQTPIEIKSIEEEDALVCIEGLVFERESRELKGGKNLVVFSVSDGTNSISVKLFVEQQDLAQFDAVRKGERYKFEGRVRFDTYEKEMVIQALAINTAEQLAQRMDSASEKRIELHAHTTMSAMDALPTASALIKRAAEWGHEAIAITDHGVLQAFPEAMEAGKKHGVKILYGLEAYLVNDQGSLVVNARNQTLTNDTYIVFDIETTGFSFMEDRITEIGAVKIRDGEIVARYSQLVNPERSIPERVVEITGITEDMVRDMPTIDSVIHDFMAFVEDGVLVAHNAKFDVSFIRYACSQQGVPFNPTVVDTLSLSRMLLKDLKRHKLNLVAKHLGIELLAHHRAVHDAEATAGILLKFFEMLMARGVENLDALNAYGSSQFDYKSEDSYHTLILVKDLEGLKNLYEMVTHSHIETFYKKPRIPKSMLDQKRGGLIIGTACESGELFQAFLSNQDADKITEIAEFYDFLEIQPVGNNQFLIDKEIVRDVEALRDMNRRIVALGAQLGKPVVATGDLHFIDPEDEVYRRIIMAGQGFGDAEKQPPLYFKTTDEMLQEFSYLGRECAREVVIEAPKRIADSIESILPIPDGTYPPIIEGSDTELREMCYAKARRIYGDQLPELLESRLERELNSIISNGYAVMYIIAQKLVKKSMEDGYLVGSRGSVGSSLAATMSDITEVNPLPPHYICDNEACKHSEFILDGSIGSGADLPDKTCPQCGAPYRKDGHDIPFETFLGFEGDKEPDIDLNFAGEYQACAHQYTEELFGKGYVFKAGTIGTVADKTAFGFVKKYFEERGQKVHPKEVLRLAMGCTGIKRTSGQHPGGIMVVPSYKNIHDFCPIQYPANDSSSGVITTHFDYHSISGRILKLDILGHDVPSIIKMLEDFTGIDAMKIPLDDAQTVKIFTSVETLNIVSRDYPLKIGSLGIPEFGTKFVREMLKDTQPSTFAELVRISGLSHGTDVWINNAQEFVREGRAELKDVISTRDDIMNYLIYAGIPHKTAFYIMENVRKGKGLKPEQEALMVENNVPDWYIESCKRIKYMFPKAHAVAYVMMSFRIAWFKVHHPLAFYATFFTIKVSDFDAEVMCAGPVVVNARMRELESNPKPTQKEKDQAGLMEVVLEYYARGYGFHRVDLYTSQAERFGIEDGMLKPPLMALQGLGENAAKSIVEARVSEEFISKADLRTRAKVTKTVIEVLDVHGCLKGMPDDDQLTLFQFT